MTAAIHKTEVNLDGLLEVLGKNLYSTPSVALRELVQNAHDACERHRYEAPNQEDDYAIHLEVDHENMKLTIRDNGSGLTADEITQYLATIGSGYTRVLRNKTQSENMIGYFGLGFLSAYVISSKVEVITTSWQTPDETWLFSSAGGKSFSVRKAPNEERGTRVVLQLAQDYQSLANVRVLSQLLQRYCSLLAIPIYLNSQHEAVNQLKSPWQEKEISELRRKKIAQEFCRVFETDFEPLTCIVLPENELELKGVLWIQDGGTYASSDNRNASVFIRGMFITDEDRELIPRWAGIVGGVFESVHFMPTASRESLQKDDYYHEALDYIREQLIIGLRDIVLKEPETWRRILKRHNQSLLGAAVSDPRLFEACRKTLKVPTTMGDLTLPKLIQANKGTIYIKPEQGNGYEEILFRAKGFPLVQGYMFGATPFCQMYAESENVPLHLLGTHKDELTVFNIQNHVDEETTTALEQAFLDERTELKFARFEPSDIPLILVPDREVQLKQKIDSEEADKRISAAALSLARLHTKAITREKDQRLYLNLDNPLIKAFHLVNVEQQRNLSAVLKSFMKISGKADDSDDNLSQVFSQLNTALISTFGIETGDA